MPPSPAPASRPSLRLAALAALGLATACSGVRLPDPDLYGPYPGAGTGPDAGTASSVQAGSDEVVVLVPGITGVKLRDPGSGKLLWGTGGRLIWPRDGGYRLALPLSEATGPGGEGGSALEPAGLLLEIRLACFKKPVYAPILDLLQEAGYRLGDLSDPRPGESLFAFEYDWRKDNVVAARLLASRLDGLRAGRRDRRLRLTLICQSNGGHICRYLAKYWDVPLEAALAGGGGPPEGIEVGKVIFIGTSNGGSLRILRFLNEGRTYLPLGRTLHPEALFTFPSLFQDLPGYRRDLFLDADGNPREVDLFDPESWKTYGWSVFGGEAAARLERGKGAKGLGTAAERVRYLAATLARARDLQRALLKDAPGFGSPRYLSIQSAYRETPERALLVQEDGRWRTYFSGQRPVRKDGYLRALAAAPGDGHATRASQLWLSPQELEALDVPPFYLDGPHFEMILEPAALRRLLELLAL